MPSAGQFHSLQTLKIQKYANKEAHIEGKSSLSLLVMGLGGTELELQAVVDTLEMLMMPGVAGK